MSTYIIAEAGVNHNGNLELAKLMIDKAKEAGVDCIKFQNLYQKYCIKTLVRLNIKKNKQSQ